jgi:hypothetical protein
LQPISNKNSPLFSIHKFAGRITYTFLKTRLVYAFVK